MTDISKINKINEVIEEYFRRNPDVSKIPAKDLMPDFIKAGIFEKDNRKGLPIRKELRKLDKKKELGKIPTTQPERKTKNTYWFFIRPSEK